MAKAQSRARRRLTTRQALRSSAPKIWTKVWIVDSVVARGARACARRAHRELHIDKCVILEHASFRELHRGVVCSQPSRA